MINIPTQQSEEISKNASDTQWQGNLGLGNAAAIQNVDNVLNQQKEEQPEETKPKEEYKSDKPEQGKYQAQLDDYNNQLDIIDKVLTSGLKGIKGVDRNTYLKWVDELAESGELKDKAKYSDWETEIVNMLKNKKANLHQQIYDIKQNKNYESRSDQQIREDTAYQRSSKDMEAAGLHKGLMFGGGGSAGSSAGSKSDEEEEKRKRRRKAARRAAEARRRENMRLLSGLAVSSTLGVPTMMNAKTNKNRIDIQQQKADTYTVNSAIKRETEKSKKDYWDYLATNALYGKDLRKK